VDIDPVSLNIDPDAIRGYMESSALLHGSRVVGIIPVHLYGKPCEMDAILAIADEYDLFVVEDIAQAFGAAWNGRKLGSHGDAGAFSFFPSKNLGGFGDGGMVSTNDGVLADLIRMLLKHGGKDKYNVDHIGYNGRLDTLQAAVLLAKFRYIDEFNNKRSIIAEAYTRALTGIDGLSVPQDAESPLSGHTHVYHQYTVRTPRRDGLQAFLKKKGISSMVYYPYPLHKMKVFHGRTKIYGELRNSEQASREVLSLPIEPLQTMEDTMYIAESIREFFGRS
jgi:dTDP-4-amino-4,6-dideoxygalactose transaminase